MDVPARLHCGIRGLADPAPPFPRHNRTKGEAEKASSSPAPASPRHSIQENRGRRPGAVGDQNRPRRARNPGSGSPATIAPTAELTVPTGLSVLEAEPHGKSARISGPSRPGSRSAWQNPEDSDMPKPDTSSFAAAMRQREPTDHGQPLRTPHRDGLCRPGCSPAWPLSPSSSCCLTQ